MKPANIPGKDHLQQALREIPQDNALSDVRYHIRAALTKLEMVEVKRSKQSAQQKLSEFQNWQAAINSAVTNPYSPRQTLDTIENMIDMEKAKIEEIRERRRQQTGSTKSPLEDDGEMLQDLFG